MADDGTGRDISIPGVLISKKDGDKLKKFWNDNINDKDLLESIVIEVNLDIEKKSFVDFDLFFISDNEVVYRLLADFFKYYKDLENLIKFNAHYVTYQSSSFSKDMPYQHVDDCYGGGRYCNSPGKFKTNSGRTIVRENIKQKCIYEHAYKKTHEPNLYWNYMDNFRILCLNNKTGFTEDCSKQASSVSEIPELEIHNCMKQSFVEDAKTGQEFPLLGKNTILEEENKARKTFKVSFIPAMIINGRNYYGSWTAENVFEAVCAGFLVKPDICHDKEVKSTLGWGSVFLIVFVVILINGVIFYFCRNLIKRKIVERIEGTDINHKINTVVTSYLALRDNK